MNEESPEIEIKCVFSRLTEISELIEFPKNPNKHPPQQIEALAKVLKLNGWRIPIIVSNRSGFVVSGHCRIAAAKLLRMTLVPVDYQDFVDEAHEYQFVVSDNAIAELSELDRSQINLDLPDFGPLDLDALGLLDFKVDPSEKYGSPEGEVEPDMDFLVSDASHTFGRSMKEEIFRRSKVLLSLGVDEKDVYLVAESMVIALAKEETDESIARKYQEQNREL